MRNVVRLMVCMIILCISLGLCACNNESIFSKQFQGKWELCGLAPKDKEMSAKNIISGEELKDLYGLELKSQGKEYEFGQVGLSDTKNIIEFTYGGSMIPYTDGSIPGVGVKEFGISDDDEDALCYTMEIYKLDGKDRYDNPIEMKVYSKIVDGYLFVWEKYNTDEFAESDTYSVYQKM